MNKSIVLVALCACLTIMYNIDAYGWSAVDGVDTHAQITEDVIDDEIDGDEYPDIARFFPESVKAEGEKNCLGFVLPGANEYQGGYQSFTLEVSS